MNILLLGSGGREHALAWKIAQSSQCAKLFIAPGNTGTALCGTNIDIKASEFEKLYDFVKNESIEFIVCGPEDPLVEGVYDFFKERNIPLIGPSKAAAQLEGSKAFSKKFMQRHAIPTATYLEVDATNLEEGLQHIENTNAPYVLKADGLAAGKGVLILESLEEAKLELYQMLADQKFGKASAKVVVEQFLKGIELSVFVLTDGDSYKILPEAKDYKRIGEKDTGLNTGGMGAVSPVPFAQGAFLDKVTNQIIIPTIKGLKQDKIPYKGFIFFGLINVKGEPYVIEYNCRMGDPETEVVIPRLKSDILDLFEGIATNTLSERDIQFFDQSAATVMMVSGGYPEKYSSGKSIYGLNSVIDSLVFHAGTTADGPSINTAGGRVLAVTSYGKNIESALAKSYENIQKISFDNAYYRKDIGFDLL